MKEVKILIIDDHPAMRHGLRLLIEAEPGFAVSGEAGDRGEALESIKTNPPDFVVLDIALKDQSGSGLDLIPEIQSHAGRVPILVYSMHDEMIYAERALRCGASGYLNKQAPVKQVVNAIRTILDGGFYLDEAVSQMIIMQQIGKTSGRLCPLSPQECLSSREFEVFRLLGKGLKPREIGERLCISCKTVETHRMHIRKKLGLSTAAELARFAVEWVHRSA